MRKYTGDRVAGRIILRIRREYAPEREILFFFIGKGLFVGEEEVKMK